MDILSAKFKFLIITHMCYMLNSPISILANSRGWPVFFLQITNAEIDDKMTMKTTMPRLIATLLTMFDSSKSMNCNIKYLQSTGEKFKRRKLNIK
jgi:hypothetical protein